MKKRNRLIFVAIILIACLGLLWFKEGWHAEEVTQTANSGKIANRNSKQSPQAKLVSILRADNVPIQFYGIVVDEKDQPLAGAAVSWTVVKSGTFAPSLGMPTGAAGIVKTNADGKFSIAESGTSISIDGINKDGYRESTRMIRSFGYGSKSDPHVPQELRPEKFLMIPSGTAPAIKKEVVVLKFNWDGESKEFDIGSSLGSETLILTPTRDPQKAGQRGYNWKLVLRAKNGGLALGRKGGPALAPEVGYQDEVVIKDDAGPEWLSMADELLYLRTESGQYAELDLNAYSNRGIESLTGSVRVRWGQGQSRAFD